MALDKQKILNELGNVVNQLQSADCGCMGKLFSNSNQANQNTIPNAMATPMHDGYMRGCCHGHAYGQGCNGYNASGAGEPFSGNRHCMGFCNPPKLYADTYNYLNHNMMQPVVKEVYDDLKSITPVNTMGNNPMAAQMGLGNKPNSEGASNMGGQMGNMAQNQMPGRAMGNANAMSNNHHAPNVHFGNVNMENMNNAMQMGDPNSQQKTSQMGQPGQMGQPMGHMGGMGPNILNMMMGDAASRVGSNPNQGGTPPGGTGYNGPQSPETGLTSNMRGEVGQGQYNVGIVDNNPGQYNSGNMGMNNMGLGNPGAQIQNPNTQYMSQPNMYARSNANMQGNTINSDMSQMNPGSQQMQTMSASPAQPLTNARNPYGQHGQGIAKFNEMFPGVMQGGDLGFDPMAIAIQMNPANQQRAAMDTMQKMMMSSGEGRNKANASLLQPVINATNAAVANITQSNQPPPNQAPAHHLISSMQQQQLGANAVAVPVPNNQVPQQQVYTALTGAPTINQQQVSQQQIPSQQQQYQQQHQENYQQPQQQMVDPNTGAIVTRTLPTVYEGSGDPNARQETLPPTQSVPPITQQMIKEPIFPADTSKNLLPAHINTKPQKYYQYNTLGQPIEMLPANLYHAPEPNLPQTLSPQTNSNKFRADQAMYSNVKATISKTSLMGNRPIGRTPSRGQLQHIYNQYKGSQSYTQQNIKPPDNGASYSEGRLNVPQGNAVRQVPIERVGGDTAANNAMNNPVAYKSDQMLGQVGDVPATNKPVGDSDKRPANQSKVRNGLQDMTYTSYATSAAWTFHGATPAPFPTAYRFRNKI